MSMQTNLLASLLSIAVARDEATEGVISDVGHGLLGPAVLAFVRDVVDRITRPIDMVLHCPKCGEQHIDAVTETWPNEPHRTHLCHSCGHRWRPADVVTNGVAAVKTRGKDDDPIVTPKPSVPDWEAVKDKRMSELTTAQQDDAKELWMRIHIASFNATSREHIEFLLRRLDEARGVK